MRYETICDEKNFITKLLSVTTTKRRHRAQKVKINFITQQKLAAVPQIMTVNLRLKTRR